MKANLLAGIFASLTIFCLGLIDHWSTLPILIAPFGASCVLLFGFPESKFASYKNLIGGHLIASFSGLALYFIFPESLMAMSLSVGIAITLMLLTDTVHPPAGANPLLIFLTHAKLSFIATPILLGVGFLALSVWSYRKIILQFELRKS